MKTEEIKSFVRSGGYAWPGGYPMFALCADGEVLCAEAVRENYRLVLDATRNPGRSTDWEIVAIGIHWEGEPLTCAHLGKEIPSAYGEVDE